ncbi:helix-turn-helix domain-containing protein [Streptomyces avermitilis]|uniref:HTH arsR-type domain-containing protein n=1 Tax=Streptomyces avermitilis TaxID=33903 RepID=A0A4D4M8F0_STRAX|nr:hypothetical protein SAV14893_076340 [Streptomyces avermitilis]GDY71399.1 hypothetical protein SAV31267_008840 [Streptomyces avermitilis]
MGGEQGAIVGQGGSGRRQQKAVAQLGRVQATAGAGARRQPPRSAAGRHLAILESAGLVLSRLQGREEFHDLNSEPLSAP